MKHAGIKIMAPPSLSNLAVGFDILGMALDLPGDEVIAWKTDQPGVHLSEVQGDKSLTPRDAERNAVSIAALEVMSKADAADAGIALALHKKIPVGSGLGGSAASAVAGAMAANELQGRPFDKRDLLPMAMHAEQTVSGGWYADNVCASMLGGLIFLRDNRDLDVHRLPIPRGMYVTVVLPEIRITTIDSRVHLRPEVGLDQLVQQTGNLAGFIQGMWQSDYGLIGRSMRDVCVEPQRAASIPGFHEMQEQALRAGALGCSISGSGPAVFALADNSMVAEEAGLRMMEVLNKLKCKATLHVTKPNTEGVIRC